MHSKARWILICRECRTRCIYSEIPGSSSSAYFLPKKPHVPDTGIAFTCPHCNHRDTYRRSDLAYEDDATSPKPSTDCHAAGRQVKQT